MCPLTVTALIGLAAGCPPPPGPADLLAPADPAVYGHWMPPPSPIAGLRSYRPVEASAQGWFGGNAPPATKRPAPPPMPAMPGMPGQDP